jgi:hypothetical protein
MLPGVGAIPLAHTIHDVFPLADRGPQVGRRFPQTLIQSLAPLQSCHGSLLCLVPGPQFHDKSSVSRQVID